MPRIGWIAAVMALSLAPIPAGSLAAGAPLARAAPPAGATVSASAASQAGQDQDEVVKVGLVSGAAAACLELPGGDQPTLGCTVTVGQAFQLPLAGWAYAEDSEEPWPLSLSAEPLPSGASFQKIELSLPVIGPVSGLGRVDARFDFTPAAEHLTGEGEPIEVMFTARADGVEAETSILLRLTVQEEVPLIRLEGYVFEDVNGDGTWSSGEDGLQGWSVELSGPEAQTLSSESGGRFVFQVRQPGSYQVAIIARAGWTATTPTSVSLVLDEPAVSTPLVLFGQRDSVGGGVPPLAELSVDRGCHEQGAAARYVLGEAVRVSLRVSGLPQAIVVLDDDLPDGSRRRVVNPQRISGSRWYSLMGTAGMPTGRRTLRLAVYRVDNSSGVPDVIVPCSFTVDASSGPSLQVDPTQLDFPATTVGQTSSLSLTMSNNGGASLSVSALGLQGGPASPFGLGANDAAGFVLPAGGSRVVEVSFSPPASGSFQDTLVIQSDDPVTAVLGVNLSGSTEAGGGLSAHVTTDRGCEEDGQTPVYFVGDSIRITYGATDPSGGWSELHLEDLLPDGRVRTVLRRNLTVGQDAIYDSTVQPPIGRETLRLTASSGNRSSQDRCTFQVAGAATRIVGYKFADLDGDGVWDGRPDDGSAALPGAEPAVPGWTMSLVGPESASAVTDENGRFEFTVSLAGNYTVSEVQGPDWRPITPPSVSITVWGTPGETMPEILFGNQPIGNLPTPTALPTSLGPTSTATSVLPPSATPLTPGTPPPSATASPIAPTQPPLPTDPPGLDCVAREAYSRLALGGNLVAGETPACFALYVPTRWGGELELNAGAGRISLYAPGDDPTVDAPIAGPSGRVVHAVGQAEHGWYRLVVRESASSGFTIGNRFWQDGQAQYVPWNFWFFPESPFTRGPHLFAEPGALTRYDARFGLGRAAWRWEVDNHRNLQAGAWWGHCWGACLASMVVRQPVGSGGFSQDDLEGLSAAFFDGFGAMGLEWAWPFVKPSPSYGDQADLYADNFHARLREYVRMRRLALHMDLRQTQGVGTPQVWNHAVYKYLSEMVEDSEAVGDPWTEKARQIRIRTVLTANADFYSVGGSAGTPENGPKRQQEAVYSLIYGADGDIVPDASQPRPQNWRSMTLIDGTGSAQPGTSLYIPGGISDASAATINWTGGSMPQGRNPHIDSSRLEQLGLRLNEVGGGR